MKTTWHIHIKGQVQGVGFRPFVFQKAGEFAVNGWVNNAIDGVHCEFNADETTARQFYQALTDGAPPLSEITAHMLCKANPQSFESFRIVRSATEGRANLLLTPDFAMCGKCEQELFADDNRRGGYPFITCTHCGPRYSIIRKLPYDRETTTMESFSMCDSCLGEYEDALDRRYYSQTNSCATCGITLSLYDAEQRLESRETGRVISQTVKVWQAGKIVAIKGIGGYLLTCDATNARTIQRLRKRKRRPSKPFAVMYPDFQLLEQDVYLGEEERVALTGAVSPIVLMYRKIESSSGLCSSDIAPGLNMLGVMIPYTPLYALLLKSFGKPIIATSGNTSNSPIVYDDQVVFDKLIGIADYLVTNNRGIAVPQDDSVITFTLCHRKKIVYRRSRGLAPAYINPYLKLPSATILATGAQLKSTFAYLHQRNIFVSQYLGDLDHYDTQQNYCHTMEHFFRLFGERPRWVLADKHPDYFSTRRAEQLAGEFDIPVKRYQHHIAHFGAVLGEHALLHSEERILGVIWDGTGLGDDGQIWGGEFFLYQDHHFMRCASFDYFDFIAGDKMAREPRISALAATKQLEGAEDILRAKFSDLEWKNYRTLLQKPGNLKTSSAGRLFDAVSSLLGLGDRSSFEGEAAMLLECCARQYIQQSPFVLESYISGSSSGLTGTRDLLQAVIYDLQKGTSKEAIAAKFHYSLVEIIAGMARRTGVKYIAFSGGVFQNALLVDLICDRLKESHTLLFHQKLSPNDETISFGQLMCYLIEQ